MRLSGKNLAVYRGGDRIFAGLSFDIANGEALLVTGANGAGKSTFLRALAGLLPFEAGPDGSAPLLVFEPPQRSESDDEIGSEVSANCHYVGHENALKPSLTVQENLTFWRDLYGNPALPVEEALDEFELTGMSSMPFGHLSTGQRRRVSLCRLLINDRPLWLLDEPTSGLDAQSVRVLSEVIQTHLADGGMVVAATHLPLGLDSSKNLDIDVFSTRAMA